MSWISFVPFDAVIENRATPSRARVCAGGNAELHERGTEETMQKLKKHLTKGLDIRTPDNLSACGNAEPCMKAHTERDKSSPVASEAEDDEGVTLEGMSPEKKVIIG